MFLVHVINNNTFGFREVLYGISKVEHVYLRAKLFLQGLGFIKM